MTRASASLLDRIGGPNAITWWSIGLTGAAWVVLTTVQNPITLGGPAWKWALTGLITQAATTPVLILAWRLLLPPRPRPPRPWVALATFAIVGAIHGWLSGAVAIEFSLQTVDTPNRMLSRVVTAVLCMSLLALFVDEVRVHRASMRLLSANLERLRATRQFEQLELDGVVADIREQALRPVLVTLDEIRGRLAVSAAAAAEPLRALIEQRVRPLSHSLIIDDAVWSAPELATTEQSFGRRLRRLLAPVSLCYSDAPWLSGLIVASIGFAASLTIVSPRYAIVTVVLATMIFGALTTLANRVGSKPLPHLPLAVRFALILFVLAVIGLLEAVVQYGFRDLSNPPAPFYAITTVVFPLVVLTIGLYRNLVVQRSEQQQRLRRTIAEIEWSIVRIRQHIRYERQVLGEWLHGPTQSALLAVLRRLELGEDRPVPTSLLPELQAAIDAVRVLQLGRAAAPLDPDALDALVRLWRGALTIEIAINETDRTRIANDAQTHTALADVLAEALANAAHHGSASTVHVTIKCLDERPVVQLVVEDDGAFIPSTSPGMGSRLYDGVTTDWTLRQHADGGAVLTAELPLSRTR